MHARRSCLSVPGSSPKMLAKASGLPADEVVIDLEDAVAASAKDEARADVVSALAGGRLGGRTVAVRVNGLDTPWCHRDIVALADGPAAGAVTSLVIPKVGGTRGHRLGGAAARRDRRWRAGDPSAGADRDGGRAAPGRGHRAGRPSPGGADPRLRRSAGVARAARAAEESPDRWSFAQETVLVAARAAGLQAIDGPHLVVDDAAGLRAWAAHVRALGYDGKWAIHPSQLDTLNATLLPHPRGG